MLKVLSENDDIKIDGSLTVSLFVFTFVFDLDRTLLVYLRYAPHIDIYTALLEGEEFI